MPWYVYIALRHLFPKGKWFPLFTVISALGPGIGVFLIVTVISVFNGFGHEIRSKISELQGDILVQKRGLFDDHEKIAVQLLENDSVVQSAPYAHGIVMLQKDNLPTYPAIQGIDPDLEEGVVPIDQYLIDGDMDSFYDDSVILSVGLARSVRVEVGDEVDIYTPLMFQRYEQDEVLLPRTMEVAAIYETGWAEVDANTVLCTLRTMQDFYGLGDSVHGIKLKLVDGADQDRIASELNSQLPPNYRAYTALSTKAAFLAAVEMEKRMMFFLLFMIVLVACLSILSSLLVSVLRKQREIGLFSAIGANAKQIAICFCLQGLAVGMVGTACGFIAA
ncbi:MAG: ABC transporter permease, partial [Verrucomicrobiota bacterium]